MTDIKTLSDVEHVLLRPGMYIGDTHVRCTPKYILREGSIIQEDTIYNPALEKIFKEVLDNAQDNIARSREKGIDPGKIYVSIKKDMVVVRNEGLPFPIGVEGPEGYPAERALSKLRTGSNFSSDRGVLAGMNGVGAAISNMMSTVFELDICNAIEKKRLKIRWTTNSTQIVKKEISDYEGESHTTVKYVADFARFFDRDLEYGCVGNRVYSEQMIESLCKYCVDASFTSKVPVVINGNIIAIESIVDYARFYYPDIESMKTMELETDDTMCLLIDTSGNAKTISFVNGLCVSGGVHIDAWQKKIVEPLMGSFKKAKLGLTTRTAHKQVFKYVSMIMVARYKNIEFSEQVKDKLMSPKPEVPTLETKGMVKWESIRLMARRLIALASSMEAISKKIDGKKSSMCGVEKLTDADEAGGSKSHLCTLYICEGQSASSFAKKQVDGTYNGVLPLQGKPLNVSKCTGEDYEKNEEIIALNFALGLKENTDYSDDTNFSQLRYGKLYTLTDQDVDGAGHIVGLIINWLRKRHPTLLEREFLYIMETPLLKVTCGRKKYNFFSSHEYKKWLSSNRGVSHTCVYLKGLGSSDDSEIEEAFTEGRVRQYRFDDDAEEMMCMAFDNEGEDMRKEWVMSWDDDQGISSMAFKYPDDTVSRFVTTHLCEYSHTNVQRSIPSLIDSMKECNRKILSVAMKIDTPIAVSDLKGTVKTKTSYRYGDDSLYRAIVCMANVCVGTNNINLLKGKGQFDSREGATAAKDRYIKAGASKVLPFIFRTEDSILLERKEDEGKKIEPHHYYPIVPLFAINGIGAIATGFASSSPAHSTIDVIKRIIWWLKKKGGEEVGPPPILKPHYNNYKGRIFQGKNGWYSEGAYEEIQSRKLVKNIRVTEIPVTLTITAYINKLKEIISKLPNKVLFKSCPKSLKYTYRGEKRIEILPNIIISGFIPQSDNVLKELGLIEKIPIQSIVLLDHNSKPKIYGSDLNGALDDFCEHRYEAYEKRRTMLIKLWREKLDMLENKKRYVREVVNGSISFRSGSTSKSSHMIVKEVIEKGYPEAFLDINLKSLTLEAIQSIDREIDSFSSKIEVYENATPISLWLSEIKELHTYLYK
jgi:DNA topoisomerase-2